MKRANFIVRVPYYDTIPVGIPQGPTTQARDLRPSTQYTFYSTPVPDPIEIWGIAWHAPDSFDQVRVQITDQNQKGIWMPLISTPMTAIGGISTQADPILMLSEPYLLQPFKKLQVFLTKVGDNDIQNTAITFCGVRLVSSETFPCFI
jgi:hypothetical protein